MQRRASAFVLAAFALFFAAAVLWHTQLAPRAFPYIQIDEQAHYSYTMDLLRTHSWWPDFSHFRMTDAATGKTTHEPNYLNHPPTFYWLMKLVHEAFPHASPVRYRILPLLFYLTAFGIYAYVGWLLRLELLPSLIYVLLPLLLYAPTQSGYYNNDSFAILGGMLACLGSFYWFGGKRLSRAFLLMAAGLTLSSVKLTSFLLVGLYIAFSLWQRRKQIAKLPPHALPLAAAWVVILALPFAYFLLQYGSPTPNAMGQHYLMRHNANEWGWHAHPHENFVHFLALALPVFADQFSIPEYTFIPLLWLVACGLLFAWKRPAEPFASMARAGIVATLIMLTVHMVFAFARYRQYGWLLDMFVRYYFPLLPAYGALAVSGYFALKGKR